MGKKYIIELPENTHWIQWLMEGTEDHHPYMDFKSVEDLTPYTEPDLKRVRKEAYDKGYHDGHNACYETAKDLMEEKKNEAYQRGLADAWGAAKKIVLDTIPPDALIKMFGNDPYSLIGRIFEVYSASEVTARIKAWEKEQKEIKVGDEVKLKCGVSPAIYMQGTNGSDEIYLLFNDGSCGIHGRNEIECKTGRSFPEIVSVLQKMRGDQDDTD